MRELISFRTVSRLSATARSVWDRSCANNACHKPSVAAATADPTRKAGHAVVRAFPGCPPQAAGPLLACSAAQRQPIRFPVA
ncbi:MAG: hypothetical protein M5U08_08220 [Burkholderiales bacterium]|nr:hypothetical protein [Burkholderiales bacterium]